MKKSLIIISALTSIIWFSTSSAETVPGTGLNVHLESANIVGSGRSINIHRLPIVNDSNGTTTVYDVSLRLTLDGAGNVVFENFSQITSPSINNFDNFIPGTYKDTVGTTYTLSGPAIVSDGRTGWALTSADDGVSYAASWITGSATGHPLIGNRNVVSNLLGGVAYGVQGTNDHNNIRNGWDEADLISAQQIGDTLVLNLFDASNSSTPDASINLTRVVP